MVNCLLMLLCIAQAVHALPSDRQKVMHVSADSASISQKNHQGSYEGHVLLIQGTTRLSASKAETYGDVKNHLVRAVAVGDGQQQAHYVTKTAVGKPFFHAQADKITYLPLKHQVILEGNARVAQGKNTFTAAKITYDSLNKHVLSETVGNKRTKIIIYPEKK